MKIYVRSDHELSEYRTFEVHYLDYEDHKCVRVIDAPNEKEAERLVSNQSDCYRILYSEEY